MIKVKSGKAEKVSVAMAMPESCTDKKKVSQWKDRIVPVIIKARRFFPGFTISFLEVPMINNVMAAKILRIETIQKTDRFSLP